MLRRREAMRWVMACFVLLGFVAWCGRAFSDCPDYYHNCGTGQCCWSSSSCDGECLNNMGPCGDDNDFIVWETNKIWYKCYAGGTCAPAGNEEQTPCDGSCWFCDDPNLI